MRQIPYAAVLTWCLMHFFAPAFAAGQGEGDAKQRRVLVDDWLNGFEAIGAKELADGVTAAAFSPDGRTLVTCSRDALELVFWNPATAEIQKRVQVSGPPVVGLKFTRDGKFLLMRFDNSSRGSERLVGVAIWDVTRTEFTWRFNTSSAKSGYSFCPADDSPDGRYVAAGNEEGRVQVWDIDAGAVVRTILLPRGAVYDIVISADGKRLLTSGLEGELTLWDVATDRLLATHGDQQQAPNWFGFMPDGTAIVSIRTADGPQAIDMLTRQAWKADGIADDVLLREFTLAALARHPAGRWPHRDESVSPDRKRMLVPVGAPCWASLLLIPSDPEKSEFIAGDQFDLIQHGFSSNNRWAYLIITEDMTRRHDEKSYSLAFWDAVTAKPAGRIEPPGGVSSIVWSADSKQALIIGPERAWLWSNVLLPLK